MYVGVSVCLSVGMCACLYVCIHLNEKGCFGRLVFGDWSFITPGAFWGKTLPGGSVWAMVVVDRSMTTPILP